MDSIDTSKQQKIIIALAIIMYILEGVLFNPIFIWVASPLIAAFILFKTHGGSGSVRGVNGAKGFLYPNAVILLLVHLAWFFDLDGTQTGSSTSALIFAVIPFYAFIIGGFGYLIGYKSRVKSENA